MALVFTLSKNYWKIVPAPGSRALLKLHMYQVLALKSSGFLLFTWSFLKTTTIMTPKQCDQLVYKNRHWNKAGILVILQIGISLSMSPLILTCQNGHVPWKDSSSEKHFASFTISHLLDLPLTISYYTSLTKTFHFKEERRSKATSYLLKLHNVYPKCYSSIVGYIQLKVKRNCSKLIIYYLVQ